MHKVSFHEHWDRCWRRSTSWRSVDGRSVRPLFFSIYLSQVTLVARYYELYNNCVFDLLDNRKKYNFTFSEDNNWRSQFLSLSLEGPELIERLLAVADGNRRVAATKDNDTSSRSHANFELTVACSHVKSSGCIDRIHTVHTGQTYTSVLNIVDLAGSERGSESDKERMAERASINKSLLFLSNVLRQSRQVCENTLIVS